MKKENVIFIVKIIIGIVLIVFGLVICAKNFFFSTSFNGYEVIFGGEFIVGGIALAVGKKINLFK